MKFECLNTSKICNYIKTAANQIVYVAPAIHNDISIELLHAFERKVEVTIIVDESPEVERMGYGNVESLITLSKNSIDLRKCSGIRIGFLNVDDISYIYSPIPTILQNEPVNNSFPNAILLSEFEAREILNSIFPNENNEVEIAAVSIQKEEIDYAVKDIEARPPVKPELARKMKVISSIFQIVDVEFKGSGLKNNSIHVNPEVLGLKNIELAKKFNIKFSMFKNADIMELEKIKDDFENLKKKYLIQVTKVGNLILTKNRKWFDDGIKKIRSSINEESKELIMVITELINRDKESLKEIIVANVNELGPEYKKQMVYPKEPNEANVNKTIDWKIQKMFGSPESYLDKLELNYKVYNVSDQLIDDKDFRDSLEKHFGKPIDEIIRTETAVKATELDDQLNFDLE